MTPHRPASKSALDSGAVFALFALGTGNGVLARFAGTCTQGDAGHLAGVVLTGGLYLIELACVIWGRPGLWLLGLVPLFLWESSFALHLAWGVWQGATACDVIMGTPPPYRPDGSERFYVISWLAVTCMPWIALCLLWGQRRA